ncbi:hypothetical protein P8C59_000304 [Phyllachora maydis]|uniref:Vacuolar fusion protein MON1 n=1 Tax=Phyllachora maydis TaxID=1825666 RepID=A0AAD9HWZ5_9PEZI|nr:hypothetical protein P8C59_000304 [Phyllachora maydis]
MRAGKRSRPVTGVTSLDIQTLSFPDGSRGTFATAGSRAVSAPVPGGVGNGVGTPARSGSMSVLSFTPTLRPAGDLASLVAGDLNGKSRAWLLLRSQSAGVQPFQRLKVDTPDGLADFAREFDEIPETERSGGAKGITDDDRLLRWKSKMKHYLVLSSAGKPIYSRHGDLSLINSYMGVLQTILSFYEGAKDPLLGFTAGNARFVVATKGPLYLVAISRLGESDGQLRDQLEALYMQILSTLTLPTLEKMFIHRPSTDLRKPLEGTESLLSSLADSFTRGSPSAMLGALECLQLPRSQRQAVTRAFLRARADKVLYGLIVADGKLVSVIRPRKHSLHPSDLQLIFNMLFESGGIKAGGGENWVPICLPAFNNGGYLYMYVSFVGDHAGSEAATPRPDLSGGPDPPTGLPLAPQRQKQETVGKTVRKTLGDEIAIVLISPAREGFFELKAMRDQVAQQLSRNGSLAVIVNAARDGRPTVAAVAPGAPLSHFIYKSRANVQFCMSSLSPMFEADAAGDGTAQAATPGSGRGSRATDGDADEYTAHEKKRVARRRLMTLYHQAHAAVHARHAHLRILHSVSEDATSLAWVTPVFELYCVAGPNASRAAVTQGADQVIQWAKREEERLFIIGGGVF